MDQKHLEVAVAAARAGAAELMQRRDSRVVSEKAPKDLVTDCRFGLAARHSQSAFELLSGLRVCRRRRRRERSTATVRQATAMHRLVGSSTHWMVRSTLCTACKTLRFLLVYITRARCDWCDLRSGL